jgi:hypothetical protein
MAINDFSRAALAVPLVQRSPKEHQASATKDFAIVGFISAMSVLIWFYFMQILPLSAEIAASVFSLS